MSARFWQDLAIFCLNFDLVLVIFADLLAVFVLNLLFLTFRLETVITATTAVALPVFSGITVFSLSLGMYVPPWVRLVTLIGRAV